MSGHTQPPSDSTDERCGGTGDDPSTPPNASMDVAPELFADRYLDGGREDSPS